ncbi:MAG: phosphatase PAP2 family protein [Taibaiella sp.]|nr:phosphatase PAP2 family protein [Taibaiella sp.]
MTTEIIDKLLYYDQVAWYYVNYLWRNPVFDLVLPFMRNQWFWVPLYFFLLLYMPFEYRKKGWLWCLGFLIAFIISDQLSAGLLKPYFHRLRPCNNPALSSVIHLMVPCGGLYGFPSSHAANHFSIGIFAAVTLGGRYGWVWPAAIVWAAVVSYSQVYVGVHYPLDVTVGGLIGVTSGLLTGKLFNRFFVLHRFEPTS